MKNIRNWTVVEGKKNLVAYERVSTILQKNEKTIKQQDYAIKLFEQNNQDEINIAYWYKDAGVSGKKDRKEYFTMINDLQEHPLKDKISGIISTSLDRLGRDAFELQTFERDIKKIKKELILLDLNITDTKEGKLIFLERMQNAREIKRELAKKGLIEYKEGRKLIEVPESVKRKMINWYVKNKLGFRIISNLLQTEPKIIELRKKYKKEKKTLKCSSGWVRLRLKEWNVEIRSPDTKKKGKRI